VDRKGAKSDEKGYLQEKTSHEGSGMKITKIQWRGKNQVGAGLLIRRAKAGCPAG